MYPTTDSILSSDEPNSPLDTSSAYTESEKYDELEDILKSNAKTINEIAERLKVPDLRLYFKNIVLNIMEDEEDTEKLTFLFNLDKLDFKLKFLECIKECKKETLELIKTMLSYDNIKNTFQELLEKEKEVKLEFVTEMLNEALILKDSSESSSVSSESSSIISENSSNEHSERTDASYEESDIDKYKPYMKIVQDAKDLSTNSRKNRVHMKISEYVDPSLFSIGDFNTYLSSMFNFQRNTDGIKVYLDGMPEQQRLSIPEKKQELSDGRSLLYKSNKFGHKGIPVFRI